MKKIAIFTNIVAVLVASSAFAAVKTYQVTGPVLDMNDEKIVVQKGSEKWEIARDAMAQVPADVKVGSKVTITYKMTATSVESKGEGAKKTDEKKAGAKKK